MDEYRTNRHWKREQDNYLTQIGAMEKIKQDPMASLGYKVRSDPEMLTLNMGADPGGQNYGLYKFFNSPERLYSRKPRSDGTLDVQVGLSPDRYAKTTVHELGHAGSRNSGTDFDYSARVSSGDEELNRRFADYLLWPPGHPGHEDAKAHLINTFNIEDYDEQAKAYGRKVGIISEADRTTKSKKADKESPKKDSKPKAPKPVQKKKKKTLKDYFFSKDEPVPSFGDNTREKLRRIDSSIDSDFLRMGIPQRGASNGMSYTPNLPPPREDIFSGANSPFADPYYATSR